MSDEDYSLLTCACNVAVSGAAPSPIKPAFNAFHLPVSRALLVTVVLALMGVPLLLFMGGRLQARFPSTTQSFSTPHAVYLIFPWNQEGPGTNHIACRLFNAKTSLVVFVCSMFARFARGQTKSCVSLNLQ